MDELVAIDDESSQEIFVFQEEILEETTNNVFKQRVTVYRVEFSKLFYYYWIIIKNFKLFRKF